MVGSFGVMSGPDGEEGSAQFAQPLVLALHQEGDVVDVLRRQLGAGLADEGGGDHAALLEQVLAHRQAHAGLLLVPRQRQVGVEQVVRLLAGGRDEAVRGLDGVTAPCVTDRVPLVGAEGFAALWNQRHALADQSGLHVARIEHLLSPAARSVFEYELSDQRHRFPAFDVDGHRVWGLTFRILENLLGDRRFSPLVRRTEKLAELSPDETFWYFSGRSSNEAGFLLQLFARLYGTNNVNNCSYYCHQASGVGLLFDVAHPRRGLLAVQLQQIGPQRLDDVFQRGIIGIDRPGIGSSTPHVYPSILDWTGDLELVADTLGIDKMHLIGLSGGGASVLAAGAAMPDRVLGIAVPRQLSITGFDDMPMARVVSPELTTVHFPMEEVGWNAGELLLVVRDIVNLERWSLSRHFGRAAEPYLQGLQAPIAALLRLDS